MRITILILGLFLMLVMPFSLAFVDMMMSDPVDILKSDNPHITQQQIDIYKKQQGLDKPLVIRFFYWVNNIAKGDFGFFESNGKNIVPINLILLASLLSGIAAVFAIKKPFVSMIIFVIAALTSLITSTYSFSFFLLLLAVFSYFGYKKLKEKAPVIQS